MTDDYKLIKADGSVVKKEDILELFEYFEQFAIDLDDKTNSQFTVPPYLKYLPRKI